MSVRILDPAGRPIANGSGHFSYESPDKDVGHVMPVQKLVSDAKGIMTIPPAAAKPAWLEINTLGYQYNRTYVLFQPGRQMDIQLKAAQNTTGLVTDSAGGAPLAGATVLFIERSGFAPMGWGSFLEVAPVSDTQSIRIPLKGPLSSIKIALRAGV
jgi:hypothetical protein